MHLLFELVNFLNEAVEGHLLFKETFDLENVKGKTNVLVEIETVEQELKKVIDKMKMSYADFQFFVN